MLTELAIRELAELGKKSTPKLIDVPGRPNHYAFIDSLGNLQVEEKPLSTFYPTSKANDIDSVVRYVDDFKGGDSSYVIWYSRAGVFGFVDGIQRERVTMDFDKSKALERIEDWERGAAETQDELVFLLKTTLYGSTDEALANSIRKVQWSNSGDGISEVNTGARSISKAVAARVEGTTAIPEYVTFTIQVFEQIPLKVSIRCFIRPIPESQTFRVIPLGNEIEKAYVAAEAEMRRLIDVSAGKESSIKVYYGLPKLPD